MILTPHFCRRTFAVGIWCVAGLVAVPTLDGPLRVFAQEKPSKIVLREGNQITGRIIGPDKPTSLEELALAHITTNLKHVWGLDITVEKAGTRAEIRNALIVGTPQSNSLIRKSLGNSAGKLETLTTEGYWIRTAGEGSNALVVASSGARGVFNAAHFVTDFLVQGQGGSVSVKAQEVFRSSPVGQRGTYNLVCWGLAPRYTRQHWENVLDAMAADGMNFIYFWLSGIFRSKLYPESFIYPETPLTSDDIRQLIRYAHARGIDFYLGTGVFAWFGIDEIAKHHDEVRELGIQHMCRTLPAAHKAMNAYLLELYNEFPEAKGMWLEIGCEGEYHCQGELCQRKLDEFGSKQIGMSELSFLKSFSAELWKKHPQAKLVWGFGYPEAHKWDVKYHEEIRKSFQDSRYYFLEVRQNWSLQNDQGILKPLIHLLPRAMHWDQYYALPLRDMGERVRRINEDKLAGYAVAFEPGFNSRSVYGKRIPFPVDLIPYALTRFAYREFTWDPQLTWPGFRKLLLSKFFGEESDPEWVDLMLTLFELMRTGPITGSFRELVGGAAGPGEYASVLPPRLVAIEARIGSLEAAAGPKARKVGLPLLRQAIADMRQTYATKQTASQL